MTEATFLLRALDRLGITVAVDDADLVLDAPDGVLTPERVARLRAAKPALVGLVTALGVFPDACVLTDQEVAALDRHGLRCACGASNWLPDPTDVDRVVCRSCRPQGRGR